MDRLPATSIPTLFCRRPRSPALIKRLLTLHSRTRNIPGPVKGGIEQCTLIGTGQFVIPVLFAPHVKVKVL
ncbi:hypothetical protein BDN71DRAFT_317260 [Pleurotus eryngii]|uniref:Uncharacterized protein n=1 Tax=Pleurotus eryngii TaxID=5323 RepID=A0A9P6DBE7_PLEER|nr:hypothetical protein BDN71DRAFT_317260 [Pleurotus eryngii]